MRVKSKGALIRDWVKQNHSVQAAIALHCNVTRGFVNAVLRSKSYSANGVIEGILADLGAPGMRDRQREAKAKARQITKTEREKCRLFEQIKQIKAKNNRKVA